MRELRPGDWKALIPERWWQHQDENQNMLPKGTFFFLSYSQPVFPELSCAHCLARSVVAQVHKERAWPSRHL